MKQWAIVGGTGFVGEHIVQALASDVLLTVYHRSPIVQKDKIVGALYEQYREEGLNELGSLENVEGLILSIQPNQTFMQQLATRIESLKQLKHIVYLSTCILYPSSDRPQGEDVQVNPVSAYEHAKALEERTLQELTQRTGKQLTILRLGNVYGGIKNRGVVDYLMKAALSGGSFTINGDGRQVRDYIHVRSVADAVKHIVLASPNGLRIWNCSSGTGTTIQDLITLVEQAVGKNIAVTHGPSVQEKDYIVGDCSLLEKNLKNWLRFDILSGIQETLATYRSYYKNAADTDMMDEFKDKIVLVTGGTGSIGSEIVRQLMQTGVKQVRVFSRDESKQFDLIHELKGDARLRLLIGDIRDQQRLMMAMEGVDVVFHAAALKHVSSCEFNPFEAVKTNVQGTQNVIDCAFANNVDKVISVSTDKAAEPTNVMGCTKLLAERLVLASYFYKGNKSTKFASVRFGNVLGSRGSVIPLFVEQVKQGGPVTVTHRDMTRFFMSIPQAVEIIFKASEMMKGQEIFILKMPVATIGDIAEVLIDLVKERHGITDDVQVELIGKKAGEREHEQLLSIEESRTALERGDMYIIRPNVAHEKYHDLPQASYPGAVPAAVKAYSSLDEQKMTREEIKKMLLSVEGLID